ncbi:Polyamine oxidase [Cyphellophora attinorum]|uniref:Polyamine oxidase n=1 Tax=Cyphellophora attinorum TaxID=1664694 RepID=A0A0N1HVJ1_9EURO|nr:Polyamine oxidase [Phialophora attinorum]KPI41316.1 Polyamine oxidase [Phialophora attinorum]
MLSLRITAVLKALLLLTTAATSTPFHPKRQDTNSTQCRKTQVLVLGGGTLANASLTDFVIIEYNNDLGGRVAHTTFGKQPNSSEPYVIELGANWVQGIENAETGAVNPIWLLAQKYGLNNTYSNYSSIETFTQDGPADYADLIDDVEDGWTVMEQNVGEFITQNIQDYSVRSGFSLGGWKPGKDAERQAVEWWTWDWEYAWQPEVSSAQFGVVNYNTTFYQWSDENNFVWDSRGFNTIVKGEAAEFLENCTADYNCSGDSRLMLNTIVTNISWSDEGVIALNEDGSCVEADFAIMTFSLGVLQNEVVTFDPELPDWKLRSIYTFQMGTYTKIFLQFPPDEVFWDTDTQEGILPVFQSLDGPGFLEGSGILFVTVVQDQSYTVEAQNSTVTQEEVMAVLRSMYGDDIPEPTDVLYPSWSLEPWTFGSYSNWPAGTSLEGHQNLRSNLGRLYFAGEATSQEYYGFLHGAWYEGQAAAETIIACLNGTSTDCPGYARYEVLTGTTPPDMYNETNGWMVTSFQGYPPDE